MNFELPTETRDFALSLSKRATSWRDGAAAEGSVLEALHEMDVLGLLSEDAADRVNREVNTVVALEELARAGLSGPHAATIWARAHFDFEHDPAAMVGDAATVVDRGERLVLHGAVCTYAVSSVGGMANLAVVEARRPAAVKLQKGHVWAPIEGAGLDVVDPGYLWRSSAASTLGHMEAALSMAVRHAQSRTQFKRTIAEFQAVQFRLAECRWRLSGLELLVREAAWRADRDDPRATAISALAWLHARTVGRAVSAHVHQVLGAIGFTDELGLTRHTGASAVLRTTISARRATATVRGARLPSGSVPPSTTLAGFRSA